MAETVTALPGLFREPLSLTITTPDGITKTLEALVVRPEGAGRFPLALITHGLPSNWSDIPAQRPQTYLSPAIAFAQRGYAAVVVMRSGYGHSTGTFAEVLGSCANRDYVKAGQAGGADVLGALRALQREAWVDPARAVLVGAPMGGFAVLAAIASDPVGVRGAISFAGAVGSPRPAYPSLWIFGERPFLWARISRGHVPRLYRSRCPRIALHSTDGKASPADAVARKWRRLMSRCFG